MCVGALLLNGVLCCHNHEEVWQREGLPTESHLTLRHRLKQRRLYLGGGSVDFICQDHIVKDRALLKAERASFRPINLCASHITGQKIWGELNAMKVPLDNLRQGFNRASFSQPGRAFNE